MNLLEHAASTALVTWFVIALLNILLIFLEENMHQVLATIVLIAVFANLYRCKIFNILAFIVNDPGLFILAIIAYLLIGIPCLYAKWYGYVIDNRSIETTVGVHKEELITWYLWWPWSMTWFLFRHPLRRVGMAVVDYFEDSLNRMARHIYEKSKKKI